MGNNVANIGTTGGASNTNNGVFQINERLTWLKGRHTLKFGGSWNHYVDGALLRRQQRRSSGSSPTAARSPGAAFGDFLLDNVSSKGRGSLTEPWTHLQDRIALLRRRRLQDHRQPDAEPRPALGLHVAARREGRPPGELSTDQRRAAARRPERQQPRALRAVLQRLGAAPRRRVSGRATSGCSAAAMASRSTWKAPARTCVCR